MLKKEITYVDYNDKEQTETFYFNLTKTELTEMEASVDDGMSNFLKRIVAAEKVGEMLQVFKNIILSSVGIKSEDGKRFIKSKEISQDFVSSPAFDVLFMELATDPQKVAEFIKAVIPQDLASRFDEEAKNNLVSIPLPDSSQTEG
jgi:hypothetical protein